MSQIETQEAPATQAQEPQLEAQCFHCKAKVPVVNAVRKPTPNGRLRVEAQCSVCNKNVSVFVSDPSKPPLSDEEKKRREKARREEKKKEKELNPNQLKGIEKKKSKKRHFQIDDILIEVTASRVPEGEDGEPKRRKLTPTEKREREIARLKEELKALKDEKTQLETEPLSE